MIPGAVLVVLGTLFAAIALPVWLRSRGKATVQPCSAATEKTRSKATSTPALPEADAWIGVNYTSPYQDVIGRKERQVNIELLLRKGSNPPDVRVHLGGKLVGELNAKNSAYLAPLILHLAPDTRLVSVAGRVQGVDNDRTFTISIGVPSAATVEHILAPQ